MLHQRQTNVTPDAMLQEVVVPGKPPLSLHVRTYIRPARLHNGAQVMLTDVYLGFEWFHIQVRRLSRHDALYRLARLATETFNMQRVQSGVIAVEYNDPNRVELNHGFQAHDQTLKHVRQLQVGTCGLRDLKDHLRARLPRVAV